MLRRGRRPVIVAGVVLEGGIRDGYRPRRHPVSSVASGPRGWVQTGNFAVTGTLVLAAAGGLARAGRPAASSPVTPALIGVAGAGLTGSAVVTTDSVSGYPPGTPDARTHPSLAGAAHTVVAIVVFTGLPAAALGWGGRCWQASQHRQCLYCIGTAVTHACGHRPGRCGLWPLGPAGPPRRAVPARQLGRGFTSVCRCVALLRRACRL